MVGSLIGIVVKPPGPIFAFAIVAALYGADGQAIATLLPLGVYEMRGTYVGMLPCSNCAGIWTKVTLEDPGVNAGQVSGKFTMLQSFTGGALRRKTVVIRGRWFVVNHRTDGGYQESGAIELLPEQPDGTPSSPRFFKCVLGQKLEALDRAKQPITNARPHTLYRNVRHRYT